MAERVKRFSKHESIASAIKAAYDLFGLPMALARAMSSLSCSESSRVDLRRLPLLLLEDDDDDDDDKVDEAERVEYPSGNELNIDVVEFEGDASIGSKK